MQWRSYVVFDQESEIAPLRLSRMCNQACDAQKMRNPYKMISNVPATSRMIGRISVCNTYAVYCHGAKHCRRHGSAVLWIFGMTHHHRIARLRSSQYATNSHHLYYRTLNIAPIVERMTIAKTETTMHDQALRADTTGFILTVLVGNACTICRDRS